MMDVGRICVKIAGRDSGKKCVIVEKLDEQFAMIDGETRRRKCNLRHLEPTKDTVSIKDKADHATVVAEFKKLGIDIKETKPKQAKEKPKQVRAADRKKAAPKPEKKDAKDKKPVKKDAPTKTEEKPVPVEKKEEPKVEQPAPKNSE